MTSIIKSLLGKKRQPAPEEIEALDRANKVLQYRVAKMAAESTSIGGKAAA